MSEIEKTTQTPLEQTPVQLNPVQDSVKEKLKASFGSTGAKQWLPAIKAPEPVEPEKPKEDTLGDPNLIVAIQQIYQSNQAQVAGKTPPVNPGTGTVGSLSDQTSRWGSPQKRKSLK